MKKKISLILICLVAFSVIPVQANRIIQSKRLTVVDPARICYAMDIVFLIDQSASMSGETYPKNAPNDPLNQRISSPKYAIDWLANNRIGLCPGVVHRIGIISFGTEAEVDLQLTKIDPADQKQWDEIRRKLEEKVQEKNLNATNPLAAFKLAKEMLGNAEQLGSQPRKRAIVLLTDGQPCVPDVGCSSDPEAPVNVRYMQDLLKYIQDNFKFDKDLQALDDAIKQAELTYGKIENIPDEDVKNIFADHPVTVDQFYGSTYIFILAMNARDPYLDIVGEVFKQIASEHGGELIDLQQNDLEVPKQFNRVLSQLAGVTPKLFGCGNLAIDPYLSGAVLDVFKMAEGLEVEIKYNGKSLKAGQGDVDYFGMVQYSQFGAVEHYRFVQPQAGLWTIDATNCNGIESSFIPFKANVVQLEPSAIVPQYLKGTATSDPDYPYYLKYRIEDTETGLVLNSNPDYPLTAKASITGPDGTITQVEFEFAGNGEWVSKQAIPTNQLGDYKVEIEGRADCVVDPTEPERCPQPTFQVFKFTDGVYSTKVVSPFRISIISPIAGKNLPLHGTLIPQGLADQSVQIQLQVLDEKDKPLNYNDVFLTDPSQALNVVLTSGKEIATVTMSVDPTDSSILVGETSRPFLAGTNTVIVNVLPKQYDHEKYIPYDFPLSVSFQRSDPLFQNPLFYRILLWILILGVVGLMIFFIYGKSRALRGELIFTSGIEHRSLSLSGGWYTKTFGIKRASSSWLRDLNITKLVVQNGGCDGNTSQVILKIHKKGGKSTYKLRDVQKTAASSVTLSYTNPKTGILNSWLVTYSWGGSCKGRISARPHQQSGLKHR